MQTVIDTNTWTRRSTYEFFKDYDDPFFNLSADLDVTLLYRFCKEQNLSFSLAALYASLVAANEVREFRIRRVADRLVEFDQIHATQTILNQDETFSFAFYEVKDTIFTFDRESKIARDKYKQLKSFDVETGRLDLIYYSVIPWVSFTSFKHASRHDNSQSVPRIVFGKVFERDAKRLMPVSIEVNHAIMDGFHVGKFFQKFQAEMDACGV